MTAWLLALTLFWQRGPAVLIQPPAPTDLNVYRMDRATIINTLVLSFFWRRDAAEWATDKYPVYVWRRGNYPDWAGLYIGNAIWLVSVTDVPSIDPVGLEHEEHHAWDDGHGQSESAGIAPDMARLALDPTHAGQLATGILRDYSDDRVHLNHYLSAALNYRLSEVPTWYRERWFGYARVTYRTSLPVVPR